MRVSEGVLSGRFIELYNPEMFQEHETVIVFTRDDVNRRFIAIMAEIDYITKIYLHLDRDEEWKLMSYWPKIMQSVQHIDFNIDLIFKNEPLQAYLDAYIYDNVKSTQKNVTVPENKAVAIIKASNNLL